MNTTSDTPVAQWRATSRPYSPACRLNPLVLDNACGTGAATEESRQTAIIGAHLCRGRSAAHGLGDEGRECGSRGSGGDKRAAATVSRGPASMWVS